MTLRKWSIIQVNFECENAVPRVALTIDLTERQLEILFDYPTFNNLVDSIACLVNCSYSI